MSMSEDTERVAGVSRGEKHHGDDIDSSVSKRSKTLEEILGDELSESRKRSDKVNKITWKGYTFYCSMTLEEYEAYVEEMREFMMHPPGWDDPNTYKEQAAEYIHECFPIIQKTWPEMADYKLVETMDGAAFLAGLGYAHLNFKVMRKDNSDGDSSVTMYFAEFDIVNQKVLCLAKVDPSTGSDPHCIHCHPDGANPWAAHVYHPANDDTWLGSGKEYELVA